jgi:hypothetical protein
MPAMRASEQEANELSDAGNTRRQGMKEGLVRVRRGDAGHTSARTRDMTPDTLFDEIAADLAPRGATAGAMFGKRALKAHGRAFACLKGDLLAFRLGDGTGAHAEALAMPGAELFDPSGKHRAFKDWVAIPASHAETWPHYAQAALDAVTD